MDESKVLAGKTRRALDSTVLDDAVARQDTVTMLATQIRRVRKLIPELVSVWVPGRYMFARSKEFTVWRSALDQSWNGARRGRVEDAPPTEDRVGWLEPDRVRRGSEFELHLSPPFATIGGG